MVSAMSEGQPLDGKVVLVTGVSRRVGIAAAVLKRALADGASVFATGWSPHDAEMPWGEDSAGGQSLIDSLDPGDGRVHYEPWDMADSATPAALIDAVCDRFGAIDIVLAVHARSSHTALAEVTAAELDLCWAVNARASVLLAQALGRRFDSARGWGRLVLFTSGQHIEPMGDEIAYAVSKGAIHQMTSSLSDQLIDQGITVNCINPGPVDTGYATGQAHADVAAMFPAGRWGQPDDVANLVSWLTNEQSSWVTGQTINSEGGWRRRTPSSIEDRLS